MTITGSLGVHAREVGAVDLTITSSNFELLDNELGKGGVESNLKVTGELRRPKIEGEVRLQAARLEVDKILALFYDPYSVNAIADVVSADQTTQNSRGAEDATSRALSNAQSGAAATSRELRPSHLPRRRRSHRCSCRSTFASRRTSCCVARAFVPGGRPVPLSAT